MKKFMKENYLNSNIKLNRFNGFLSVAVIKTSLKYFDFRFIITYNSIFIIAECFAFFAYSKYILN